MSLAEEQRIQLSQLVDGELPIEEANRVLASVLGDLRHAFGNAEGAKQLYAMLQLRQVRRVAAARTTRDDGYATGCSTRR